MRPVTQDSSSSTTQENWSVLRYNQKARHTNDDKRSTSPTLPVGRTRVGILRNEESRKWREKYEKRLGDDKDTSQTMHKSYWPSSSQKTLVLVCLSVCLSVVCSSNLFLLLFPVSRTQSAIVWFVCVSSSPRIGMCTMHCDEWKFVHACVRFF